MMEIGTVAVRIAGRRAGTPCVVIAKIDANFVEVDDGRKKRRCNVQHLEPTGKMASKTHVRAALAELGYDVPEPKPKAKVAKVAAPAAKEAKPKKAAKPKSAEKK